MADVYGYTQAETDRMLAGKADRNHTHGVEDIGIRPAARWTPKLIAVGSETSELAIGNGSIEGQYVTVPGRFVHFRVAINLGSSTASKAGHNLAFTLPDGVSLAAASQTGPALFKRGSNGYQLLLSATGRFEGLLMYAFAESSGGFLDAEDWSGDEGIYANFTFLA